MADKSHLFEKKIKKKKKKTYHKTDVEFKKLSPKESNYRTVNVAL